MYQSMRSIKFRKGFTIVEAVVATSIVLVIVSSLVVVNNSYIKIAFSGVKKVKATLLAEETIEVVKLLRDQSWIANIVGTPVDTNRFLSYNSGLNFWATTTDNIFVDSLYERKFILENVYRDGNNDIASSGTLDGDARLVTATVSWLEKGATSTKTISTYIFNLLGN